MILCSLIVPQFMSCCCAQPDRGNTSDTTRFSSSSHGEWLDTESRLTHQAGRWQNTNTCRQADIRTGRQTGEQQNQTERQAGARARAHTHTHTHTDTHTRRQAHTHTHTHTHTRARARMHAHTHTHRQTDRQMNGVALTLLPLPCDLSLIHI